METCNKKIGNRDQQRRASCHTDSKSRKKRFQYASDYEVLQGTQLEPDNIEYNFASPA